MTFYYKNIPMLHSRFSIIRAFTCFVLGYVLGDHNGRRAFKRSYLRPLWLSVEPTILIAWSWLWRCSCAFLALFLLWLILWLGYSAGCVM